MTGLLINPGSGGVSPSGRGWTNTYFEANRIAMHWLSGMCADGLTDIELCDRSGMSGDHPPDEGGRWCFTFRHTVTGTEVWLRTHGIDDLEAYRKEHLFDPRIYWNGSSSADPHLSDFRAPGFAQVKTYRKIAECRCAETKGLVADVPRRYCDIHGTHGS